MLIVVLYRTVDCIVQIDRTEVKVYYTVLICIVHCTVLGTESLLSMPRGRRSLYILSLLFSKSPWLLIR